MSHWFSRVASMIARLLLLNCRDLKTWPSLGDWWGFCRSTGLPTNRISREPTAVDKNYRHVLLLLAIAGLAVTILFCSL
jgi:hypothetical protein